MIFPFITLNGRGNEIELEDVLSAQEILTEMKENFISSIRFDVPNTNYLTIEWTMLFARQEVSFPLNGGDVETILAFTEEEEEVEVEEELEEETPIETDEEPELEEELETETETETESEETDEEEGVEE